MKLRKIFKITGIVLLILAVVLTCFHFWFINRSISLLQNLVTTQSKGTYKLSIRRLHYNYLQLIFRLDQPTLTSLDSTSVSDQYDVSAKQVTINLKQLLPLILKKELRFDAVLVDAPNIRVTHQYSDKDTVKQASKELNISEDMFNAYASLRNALGQLQVDKFTIRNGSFTIVNTGQPVPLTIAGIDFVVKGLNINPEKTPTYDPLAITDSIGLAIAGQRIVFPDGQKSISFRSFNFNSVLGAITLDSFQVISRSDSADNNFNVFAEKLSLKKFKLVSRDGEDFTQIDSVFFTRPVAKLLITASDEVKTKDTSASAASTLHKVVETITGNGSINYIGINNVLFDITALKKDKESHFLFVQDKLELGEVQLNKNAILPVSIGSLRFGLRRYTNYFNDSAYFIQFDSVKILNGQLALYDFQLHSTKIAPQLQQVSIPVLLLNGVDWYRLIFEKKFVAKSIAMYDPQITVTAPAPKGGKGGGKIQDLFLVDHVLLQNANVKVLFSKNEYAQVKGLGIDAATATWLRQPNLATTLNMLKGTSATEINLVKGGWNVNISGPKLTNNTQMLIHHFKVVNKAKKIEALGEDLDISNVTVNESRNRINIENLSWKTLTADVTLPEKKGGKQASDQPDISIGRINFGPTKLRIKSKKIEASMMLSSIKSGRLRFSEGKADTLQNLVIVGRNWNVKSDSLNVSGNAFTIVQQQASFFSAVQASINGQGTQIRAKIPEIQFAANLAKFTEGQAEMDYFRFIRPDVAVVINNPPPKTASQASPKDFPLIQIGQLELLKPVFSFSQIKNRDTVLLEIGDASFTTGVNSTANTFSLRQMKFSTSELAFKKNDSLEALLNNGNLNFSATDVSLFQNAADKWKISNAALLLSNAGLKTKKPNGKRDTLIVPSFDLRHFSASDRSSKDWRSTVFGQPEMQLQNVFIRYRSTDNIIMVDDLHTVIGSNNITMASFFFHPQLAEEAYIKAHPYETDFMRAKTGRLSIFDFNRQAFIRDSVIRIRHISIDDVDFRDTRDKTPPFKAGIIKPLPASAIRKIPFDVSIDSMTLQNSKVTYKEVSEQTGEPGTLYFTRLQSRFLNIKSRNQTIRDTFQWHSNAYIMDTMGFYMGLKTAYMDSLDELRLTVRLNPTDITPLNTFFAPLAAIKFKSAMVDTLVLEAVANDIIAHGDMKFLYHNLKVEFLNSGDTAKKGIFKSLLTFLANQLVIKNKNKHRIGAVYFERIRDRSIFNYIVKMVMSGMKTSIGAQKSRKMEKAYEKKLAELGWQPLEE